MSERCHCGAGDSLDSCCGPYITGEALPETAEHLMRSRYSAFVEQDQDYLLASWHPATRPSRVRFDPDQRWLGLSIRGTAAGGPDDDNGTVEFVARYKIAGKGYRLHETSRFARLDGRWVYRDGEHH